VEGEEILDQSRKSHFLKSRKGLGPLILPHFNQQAPAPQTLDVSAFQHAPGLTELGIRHPFQHGIGRYAPWCVETGPGFVRGHLDGSDTLHGRRIREWNGFDFSAAVTFALSAQGLEIHLRADGEKILQAGIHYYYDLKDRATAKVLLPVERRQKAFTFERGYDEPFKAEGAPDGSVCYRLETRTYRLDTIVRASGRPENRFEDVILFSPENFTCACVEPLTYLDREKCGRTKVDASITLRPSRKAV
jgi:hypothetical protein